MMQFRKDGKKNKKQSIQNILPASSSKSAYAEAFRTLRANLHFSMVDRSVKSIVITSALQSEGKTNTTINLGYTIANTGKRVLLVDSDLRKPFLTNLFDLRGKKGFTDLVVDTLDQPVSQGSLENYSIGDLIQLVKYQRQTGKLELISESNKVSFYIKNGETMDAVWENRPAETGLVAAMVRENALTRDAADKVLKLNRNTGRRVRSLLLSMGFINKPDLEQRLAILAAEAARLGSGMVSGTFSFTPATWNAMELSLYPDIDFDLLFQELFGQADDLIYMNRSIDNITRKTENENLWVIGAGKIPPNPSEIIGSERAEMIIGLLKQKFDFIIFDIAPVLPASDAMLMAPRTDGVLMVIRAGYSNKKLVKRMVDQFRQSNLPILGTVLNRVDVKRRDYYYQYYREY